MTKLIHSNREDVCVMFTETAQSLVSFFIKADKHWES